MKYTKYQYSRNLAWEILLKERVRQLPVEIIPICKHMGIRVLRYSDMPTLRFNDGGAFAEIGGKMYIFYDDTVSPERQRFTIAHELGHIIMQHSGAEDNEAEANVFASRLLMPACVLYACEVKTVEKSCLYVPSAVRQRKSGSHDLQNCADATSSTRTRLSDRSPATFSILSKPIVDFNPRTPEWGATEPFANFQSLSSESGIDSRYASSSGVSFFSKTFPSRPKKRTIFSPSPPSSAGFSFCSEENSLSTGTLK